MGRRDHQGRRELPRFRRTRPAAGRALARPHQGHRRARERRARACSTPSWPSGSPPPATRSPRASTTTQFPIDVFQTGSGTSSNMNANEVIAHARRRGAHPNDHVNMGQSSNDVFPSAVHLAALDEATNTLLPALEQLEAVVRRQGRGVQGHRQVRPHAPDGRRAGHARPGVRRLRRADPARPRRDRQRAAAGRADPARRHRHRHRPEHPPGLRRQGAREAGRRHRPDDLRARGPVRGAGQPRRARRAVRRAEGRRRLADQDRRRPRADGLRPARRASARSSCRSCRRAPRSCPARSTR